MGCSNSACTSNLTVEATPLERRLWATLSSQITSRLFTKLEGKLEGVRIEISTHGRWKYSRIPT